LSIGYVGQRAVSPCRAGLWLQSVQSLRQLASSLCSKADR